MEIKALTMAGSVPGLRGHLPWRGQEEGEEAAAVISPLGVAFGFTFISPKRRGAGEGSQTSTRKKRRKRARMEMRKEKTLPGGKGRGKREGGKEPPECTFFRFVLAATLQPVSLPAPLLPPSLWEMFSVTCKAWFNLQGELEMIQASAPFKCWETEARHIHLLLSGLIVSLLILRVPETISISSFQDE